MLTSPKSNIRSIRFANDIAQIIEEHEGDNFNQKFENLIRTCYIRLPEITRQLENLELIKAEKYEQLHQLEQRTRLLTDKHRLLEASLNRYEDALFTAIEQLEKP